ncbi:cupin domain-containing protein [uncultured Sphingomonas sp.]|uniref:cupin domain-containing protein n=1 Tax=uncultured Sphingomonas sp. TaxID=158754 RepID=UPI0025D90507|nr:cupin domain-containing protein [uncultured Sphingomonas sp.]
MRGITIGLTLAWTLAAAMPGGTAQAAADPGGFASAADVRAQVAAMKREMKPGQGFAWKPLVRAGEQVAAIEIWKKPGKPAVHPTEAEYAIVLEGRGTLVSGGTMADPQVTNPTLTEGSRIDGGTTRTLAPGDVLLIPAGAPHWFGITGDRLILLGTKIPAAR